MRLLRALLLTAVTITPALAVDRGQDWKALEPDPAIRAWYAKQVMPDATFSPCCGEGDAYYADAFEDKAGHFYAIITDERPDEPLKRIHVEKGTRVEIPKHKFNGQERGPNITGHGIVFLAPRWQPSPTDVQQGVVFNTPKGPIAMVAVCYFPPELT